jgi:zinc protease
MDEALSAIHKSGAQLRRLVMDNGMIGLVREDRSAPVVSVQIWVGTGSIHEQEFLGAGLSHYLEHMIFKGTPTRPPGEITRQINNAGGHINAYTSHDRTVFHADLPADKWQVGVDVLSDAVMHANFPEEEWRREKDVIRRELAMGKDNPDNVLDKLLWHTAFLTHPYRFPVIGYEDIFEGITRDDLVTFFRRNYVPDNMITVVVGDVNAAEVDAYLRRTFAEFKRTARAPVVLPSEPPQLSARFARETGAYNLSRLAWAYHSVALSDPDAPTLDLLAEIVGHGQSSRLVQQIKEKAKLVYSIEAWSYTPRDPGLFGISANFDPGKQEAVLAAIREEVERWTRTPFTPDEVEKARRMILTSILSGLQTMSGQASELGSGQLHAGDPLFSATYLRRLRDVTPESLQAAVRKYLRPEDSSVVVLGPGSPKEARAGEAAVQPSAVTRVVLEPARLTLLVREDHRLPFLYVVAACGGGLLSETESNNGITRLMADMLVRGTVARSASEIATAVESLGASLTPFAGLDGFGLQARCLTDDADTIMAILADCLLHPVFPADELAKQKDVQLSLIAEQEDRPFYKAQEALRRSLYPDHPYRWTTLGSTNTVPAISREGLRSFARRHVVGGNTVLAIFGDITPEKARRLALRHMKELPADPAPADLCAEPLPKNLPARVVLPLPREQTIILSGFLGVNMKDPRRDALEVLDTALSGLSSELGDQVREKRGLAYYVGAFQHADRQTGVFALYAGIRADALPEVETLFSNEVDRLCSRGLTDEEISRSRSQIASGYDMSLQDNMHLATTCAFNELYGLGYEYTFRTKERVQAVTADAIREAARSVMMPQRHAVSIVVPKETPPKPAAPPVAP